jgi:glycosyltransferase involved in cell wall biosynthesis
MIVKNEKDVIRRCLTSLKGIIHYWVIVDTGSTDGTQEIIRDFLREIPGELHERPWVDFSHNRNEALDLAKDKADYLLVIDADDVLVFSSDFQMPSLTKDFYIVIQQDEKKEIDTQWILLILNRLNWRWHGAVHEVLGCPEMSCSEILLGVTALYLQDGARSKDPLKYEKDAALLERALAQDPTNTRTAFYLAESYRGSKNYPMAIGAYEKRVSLGGSEEEVFWSLYCIARLQDALNLDSKLVMANYERAYQYRPSRVEPLYDLVSLLLKQRNFIAALRIAKIASAIPLSTDAVFVCRWIYEWGSLFQYAVLCKALGQSEAFQATVQKLLSLPNLPDSVRSKLL